MRQQHVLFLFGPQVCVPEDPLAAAKGMCLRTSVMARNMPCSGAGLIDDFERVNEYTPEEVVRVARELDGASKIDAVVSYDDQGVPLAARIAAALGLRGNSIEAADATRSKLLMKERFVAAKVPIADFALVTDENDAALWASEHNYPVVIKPVLGSASQAVIRADNETELRVAVKRLLRIVGATAARDKDDSFLIEAYMPGDEISVELLVKDGTPHPLCIFEKPEPLEGPFFEESIYVTPARLGADLSQDVQELAVEASNAIRLSTGPAHCEIRLTPEGPRILEIAGRLIGGACSRAFRYALNVDIHVPILKNALGEPFEIPTQQSGRSAGAMMLPISAEGTLRAVHGVDAIEEMAGIRDVIISAEPGQRIVPFPEQSCYIGFVTASGATTEEVVRTLEIARDTVKLELEPESCQQWECRIQFTTEQQHTCDVEDLSRIPLDEARAIATDLLARGQYSELSADAASRKAKECLRQLEAGAVGATTPEYWLTVRGRAIVIGALTEDCGFVACLAVLPEFRKQGLGESMLRSLMQRFADENRSIVKVVVDPSDAAAVATYRRLGFASSTATVDQSCCCA